MAVPPIFLITATLRCSGSPPGAAISLPFFSFWPKLASLPPLRIFLWSVAEFIENEGCPIVNFKRQLRPPLTFAFLW